MEIMRTANAGILLRLDNASILLDGVCREVSPYPATPLWIREQLDLQLPDALCFTHCHKDHFDREFAQNYVRKSGRPVIGPEGVGTVDCGKIGNVQIQGITTRHIGAAGADTKHMSFVICGTKCVWFLGDASPLQWKGSTGLPKPDVVLAPYAYFTTSKGFACLQSFGAAVNVLLHMPMRAQDTLGLWDAVEATVGTGNLISPNIGETVVIE